MPATEAQIAANRANARKSTGPKTPEGKEASRGNAYKHGLTATTVFPERESAELTRRLVAFTEELQPSGEVGMAYVLRAAVLSIRMERGVVHETAALTERVRKAEAEVTPPEGCDEATAARLREEAGRRALFDPSPEAALARKYEAAAERGFFKALKELRAHERALKAAEDAAIDEQLGSILSAKEEDEEFARIVAEVEHPTPHRPANRLETVGFLRPTPQVDVPFTIGKPG